MNKDLFEKYPVSKAVLTLAMPTVLSMLVTVIYNMADAIFVGQTGDTYQVAAISLINPVNIVLLSIGNIFGIGGGIYISRLLGANEHEKVRKISAFVVYIVIITSIISGILILTFMEPILNILGTSENTYKFTKDYLTILAFGAPFTCTQLSCSAIIRAQGSSKASMFGMMLGTILNIILDPIMITTLNMGVVGAAIATVIGNISAVIYFIIYLILNRKKSYLSISIREFSFNFKTFITIFMLGLPMSLNNLLMSYSAILLNNFVESYGDEFLAAIGIANRINMLSILVLAGLGQGTQPFIAYNNSNKNYKRMNEAIRFTSILSIGIGVVFLGTTLLFSRQMVSVFIKESEMASVVISNASYFIRAFMSSAPILGVLYLLMFTLQAFGKTIPAIFLSFCRQGLLFTIVLLIGNYLFKLNGIVWAQPISDVFSLVLAIILYYSINKKLSNDEAEK